VLVLLHDLVHLILSYEGALSGGCGCGHNILLSLTLNHKEGKFLALENDVTAFIRSDQRDGGRWCYLLGEATRWCTTLGVV